MDWKEKAIELAKQGMSWRKVARELDVPRTTVSDFLRKTFQKVHGSVVKSDFGLKVAIIADTQCKPEEDLRTFGTDNQPVAASSRGLLMTGTLTFNTDGTMKDMSAYVPANPGGAVGTPNEPARSERLDSCSHFQQRLPHDDPQLLGHPRRKHAVPGRQHHC